MSISSHHTQKHRHIIALPIVLLWVLAAMAVGSRPLLTATLAAGDSRVETESQALPFLRPPFSGEIGAHSMAEFSATAFVLRKGSVAIGTERFAEFSLCDKADVRLLAGSSVFLECQPESQAVVALDKPVLVIVDSTTYALAQGYRFALRADGTLERTPVPTFWIAAHAVQYANSRAGTEVALPESADLRRLEALIHNADGASALFDDTVGDSLGWAQSIGQHVWLGKRPLQPNFTDAWKRLAERTLLAPDHARQLLLRQREIPRILDAAGYPQSAQAWRMAIASVASLAHPIFGAEEYHLLQQEVDHQKFVSSVTPFTSPAGKASATPEQVSEARRRLLAAGGMLSKNTRIESAVDSGGNISVRTMYFATAQGDARFDFLLDPVTWVLSGITKNGVQLPNALQLEAFAESLK